MKKVIKALNMGAPLLAFALLLILVVHSVMGYTPATFEIMERLEAVESEKTVQIASTDEITLEDLPEQTVPEKKEPEKIKSVNETGEYKDGTYYGSANGFAGTITVKVVIKNSNILSVTIKSHSDGAEYIKKAKALLKQIVKKQTTNLDAVSGATYSSNGIIKATREALKKAAVNSTEDSENKKKGKIEKKKSPTLSGEYIDGTYTGTGKGYLNGTTIVKVTVSKNKITKLELVAHEDTVEFMAMARDTIFSEIKSGQTTKVDVVSGATYSSKGIVSAVADALAQARKKTNTNSSEEIDAEDEKDEKETGEEEDTSEVFEIKKTSWVEADGYNFTTYSIKLIVSIVNGKIKNLNFADGNKFGNLSTNQTYSEYALSGMLENLKGKASTIGVDTISGATYSSRAILEAVEKAFEAYAKQGEE